MYHVGSIPGYSHKHYTCIQIFGMTDPQNNMRSKFNRLTQVNFTVNFFKSELGMLILLYSSPDQERAYLLSGYGCMDTVQSFIKNFSFITAPLTNLLR